MEELDYEEVGKEGEVENKKRKIKTKEEQKEKGKTEQVQENKKQQLGGLG